MFKWDHNKVEIKTIPTFFIAQYGEPKIMLLDSRSGLWRICVCEAVRSSSSSSTVDSDFPDGLLKNLNDLFLPSLTTFGSVLPVSREDKHPSRLDGTH